MTTTSLQIKRSTVNTVPASLLAGELAYSGNATSNSLFIGHPDGVTGPIRIGGTKYSYLHQAGAPGALVANAVPILDANSFHATLYTSNFSIQTSGAISTPAITAINATSNSTQLGLNANTELTTTWAIQNYVSGKIAAVSGSPGGSNTQIQYNNSGVFAGAASFTFDQAAVVLAIGNTTVNTTVNSTSFSGTANNASFLLTKTWVAPGAIGSTTANTGAFTTLSTTSNVSVSTINATAWGVSLTTNATAAGIVVGNATVQTTINSTSFSGTANNATNLGGVASGSYALLASPAFTGTASAANLVVSGTTNTALLNVSGNAVFSGAVVNATASVINAMDLVLTGNLTISGTTTTLNSTNLVINDPTIQLADGNLTTDTVDLTVFGSSGNSTTTWYSGLFRDHLVSSLTQPVWKLFSSNVIPTTTVNTASPGYSLATLNSWLTSGIFVSNSTVVNITANATVSSALVANSLSLTTQLTVPSGGTGLNTIPAGSVLTGNTTGAITAVAQGVNGAFLTVSGTTTTFTNTIDAGTF